ncbi:uncharacterized protein [Haliotis asinina]|uniref:uncharacterized protein n=2 Tax=Haliotis asinina TaxID=109174 RepID=UPI0035322A07
MNGLSPKMSKLLSDIYQNVKACVRNNTEVSATFDVNIGVRQGCVLSPFLFSFFINELAVQIERNCSHGIQLHPDMFYLFLLLFADDIVLISSTINGLQKQINELETYCQNYCLSVNMNKTKIIAFKKGGKLSKKEIWYYKGNVVERTTSYKYLGVYFTNILSWSTHTKYASVQARKALIGILRNLRVLGDINLASFFRIFDTKISPILLYGAEIWGLKYFDCIEKVHLFACKTFLGVKMSTPDVMVYGECGRFPLHIFQQTRVIKYWIKLLNMSSHRLPKKCYEMMLLLHENGKQNWVSEVKNLLFSTGFHNLWYDQKVFAPSLFLNTFTQRLKDIYQQKWLGIVSLSTKCKYYSTLKTHIYTEGYLSCVNVKKFRTALSRFRCSSHDLLIEKGRFMNIKREDRLCKCCTNNAIEDEYHFLLVCPAFDTLRRKYMKEYYFVHPSIAKFSSLLTCSNEKVIQNIAIFIHKAMLSRQFFYK